MGNVSEKDEFYEKERKEREKQCLELMKKAFPEQGELDLTRFLLAREYEVKKATQMFQNYLDWKRDFNPGYSLIILYNYTIYTISTIKLFLELSHIQKLSSCFLMIKETLASKFSKKSSFKIEVTTLDAQKTTLLCFTFLQEIILLKRIGNILFILVVSFMMHLSE